MTRDETAKLDVFMAEFREFRIDDRAWKARTDNRLVAVEEFVTSEKAIDEREQVLSFRRRAYIASGVAALGVGGSIALGVVNLLT